MGAVPARQRAARRDTNSSQNTALTPGAALTSGNQRELCGMTDTNARLWHGMNLTDVLEL